MTAVAVGAIILSRGVPNAHTDLTRVYTTTAQQQAIIHFEDGTQIVLAPRTTVRLQHFGTLSRTVVLENGEAYFNVAHAAGLPFVIRSGPATTQVLGTEFLVRYTAGTSHVRVSVADGKVRVITAKHGSSGLVIARGQIADVTDSTAQVSSRGDDLTPDIEWAPGRVMFRHTQLSKVLETVSQWYGYRFRYADQTLGARTVTMMVSTRSSAEALATIEQLLAVNLTVVGDTITLVPHAPQPSRGMPQIRTYDVWTPTKEVGR